MKEIPFNRPYICQQEIDAVAEVLRSGAIHGDGRVGRRVQEELADWIGARHVFLTTSCTHALEMAMIALGIGPGDEVILPSFTFVSTANAAVQCGATPVFVDIEPSTLNIDVADVARKITPRTRLIVPVHYAGVACDMHALQELVRGRDIAIVEDAAQGIDSWYFGKSLGTIGDIGCFSFHGTKNIACGEGGAFVTSDDQIARAAEIIREKGTNRSSFMRGEISKYSWVGRGSSYIQSEILAAVLEAQLKKRDEIKALRRKVWQSYREVLVPLRDDGLIRLPRIPAGCDINYHIFYILLEEPRRRPEVIEGLHRHGIEASFHYVPLHSSPFGKQFVRAGQQFPVTSHCSEALVRLPLYPDLAPAATDVARRVAEILSDILQYDQVAV